MGNVALLGACVKLLAPQALGCLEEAIAARTGALAEANVAAARDGYARCLKQHALSTDTRIEPASAPAAPWSPPVFAVSTTDSRANHTGTWSLDRPVILNACTACAVCSLFCPEGAITRSAGTMTIDQYAGEINRAFVETYAHEHREKPFFDALIGKLIVE